jgi:hypothetical protein
VRNMEHLKQLISEHFQQESVIRVETSVVFNRFSHPELPEDLLMAGIDGPNGVTTVASRIAGRESHTRH